MEVKGRVTSGAPPLHPATGPFIHSRDFVDSGEPLPQSPLVTGWVSSQELQKLFKNFLRCIMRST